ncbi:hypothetical protein V8E54_011260 [Elaphomyces granulatus]
MRKSIRVSAANQDCQPRSFLMAVGIKGWKEAEGVGGYHIDLPESRTLQRETVELQEKELEIFQRALSEERPDTLISMANLAFIFKGQPRIEI